MSSTVIFDQTSVANTALSTGVLNLAKWGPGDAVAIEISPSGAMTTGNVKLIDPDLSASNQLAQVATGTGSTPVVIGWGLGAAGAAALTTYLGGLPSVLPPKIQIDVPALGVGVTAKVKVILHRL
jgi:hypothetical protein